jgi:hypothetical protein
MITLEKARTAITEIVITIEGFNLTVIASAEQIPNTCTVIGLLVPKGSFSNFKFFVENIGSLSLIL